MKHIILATTNDLETDQRVHRIALTLLKSGSSVCLVGRLLPSSSPLSARPYFTHRFRMLFQNGFLFYAAYNSRLLLYLLFNSFDIIVSNDLDTLLACRLAAGIKRKKLAYDSHEYFTELPELICRPLVRGFWKVLERLLVPRLKHCYTVTDSIAREYNARYGVQMQVIRNLPLRKDNGPATAAPFSFPGKKILLYQGSLNIGRGLELAIDAMQWLPQCILVIVGSGYIEQSLRHHVKDAGLGDRVIFAGRIAMEKLDNFTTMAYLGLSLEEDLGLNYRYALPNKLFDYIQSGIPVLVSALPEMASLVKNHNIGAVAESRDPRQLANQIQVIIQNRSIYNIWKANTKTLASDFSWEKEEPKLKQVYESMGLSF